MRESGVNSWNEWDPLKEVIVGEPYNFNLPEIDLSFKLFFHDNAHDFFLKSVDDCKPSIKKQYLEELIEDVENLVTVLEKLDIVVKRPKKLDKAYMIKTPYWETKILPALNVRDQTLILGDEIIETSPMLRARYFENDLMKEIFHEYWMNGSKWTVMPRPIMTDNSFDQKYICETSSIQCSDGYPTVKNKFDIGQEIMIDGAQCVRFGGDIIINVANRNHLLGFMWLKRHLENKFNLHKVHSIADNHLDSYLVPLCEGKMLLRNPAYLKQLPKFLKGWEIIYPPEPSEDMFPNYGKDQLLTASKYVDMNTLSIDGKKIIVNSLYPELCEKLYKKGFDPIPIQHRHRRIFAGGFHCFTLDTVREN